MKFTQVAGSYNSYFQHSIISLFNNNFLFGVGTQILRTTVNTR
ncbi:MAG: hypothetical protein NTX08_07525 [Sphingobacteriales bacterium]|nr:hypothetical protein [Sphingobacteriales bacterium]